MATVDDAELAALRALSETVASMEKNPKTRSALLRLVKEVKPDLSIPELDAAAPVMSELSEMRKEMKAFLDAQTAEREAAEAKRQQDAVMNQFIAQENELRDAGYLDEGIDAVRKFAQAQGIPNLLAAAALFEKQNPPSIMDPKGGGAFDYFKPDTDSAKHFDALFKSKGEDVIAERSLVQAAINEVRATNRRQ